MGAFFSSEYVSFKDIPQLNNETTIVEYIENNPDILTKTSFEDGPTLLMYVIENKNYRIDTIQDIITVIRINEEKYSKTIEKKYNKTIKNVNKMKNPLFSLYGQLNYQDRFGNTPLMVAFKFYNHNSSNDNSPNDNSPNDNSPNFSENLRRLLKILKDNGADPNFKTKNGETYLTYALGDYNYRNEDHAIDIAKILIELGVDPNKENISDRYPIEYAIKYNSPDLIQFFLEKGAKLPEDCRNTLLSSIDNYASPEIIDLLKLKECDYIQELKNDKNIYQKLDNINYLGDYSFGVEGFEFLFEEVLKPYSEIEQDKSKYELISVETTPINNLMKHTKNAKDLNTMAYARYSEKGPYTKYQNYIKDLDARDKYNLRQYTFHGDEIVNSMLTLRDNIAWYKKHTVGNDIVSSDENIVDEYINVKDNKDVIEKVIDDLVNKHNIEIFFIFYYILFDFQIEGLVKNFPNLKIKYYITNIIPRLHKIMNNLDLLREMTYTYFKGLDRIITLFPKMSYPFIVYRGVKKPYLFVQNNDETMPVSYLSTFTSTSRSKETAFRFTDLSNTIIYTFYAHPQCSYAPIETISLYPGEKEILFAPYHRYIFMSYNFHDNIHHYNFAVLPVDITPPDNYRDYKVWKEKYNDVESKLENYKKLPNDEKKKGGRSVKSIYNKTRKMNVRKNLKIELKKPANNRYNNKTKKKNNKMENNIVEKNKNNVVIKSRLETPIDVLFTRKSTEEEKKLALEIYNYFKKK